MAALNRLGLARIVAYLAVVVAGAWGLWRVERQGDELAQQNERLTQVVADLEAENLARRKDACGQADETRAIQRRTNKDSVLEYGEVIIEVASGADTPPDPAVIAALREVGERRVSAIVNQLPGRRWDPDAQECVDVPIDQGG